MTLYNQQVLNTCQESCMLLERYHSTVSPQEEMLVTLCHLPADVNTQWIQNASVAVSGTMLLVSLSLVLLCVDCVPFLNVCNHSLTFNLLTKLQIFSYLCFFTHSFSFVFFLS